MPSRVTRRAAATLLLGAPWLRAQAQGPGADYPSRPVRIVVPYLAGGATDTTTRAFAEGMGQRLGQPFVVENRAGAGTNIAATYVARAAPDGYTLLVSNFASNVLNRWLYRSLDYDPTRFAVAGMMARGTMQLIVGRESPIRSLDDLIALARSRPGGLLYGSNGVATPNHLLTELFRLRTGIPLTHVPFAGSAQSNREVMVGRVDFMFDSPPAALIEGGQIRAIATAFDERWPSQPDLPTMAELGYPEIAVTTFFGLVGPEGTPAPVLDRLNAVLVALAQEPAIARRIAAFAYLPYVATRTESEAFLAREGEKWREVIRAINLSLD